MRRSDTSAPARAAAFAIVSIVTGACLFGLDGWSRWLTGSDPAARAFILSDAFWPTVAGGAALALATAIGGVLILASIPSRSGRKAPERGE